MNRQQKAQAVKKYEDEGRRKVIEALSPYYITCPTEEQFDIVDLTATARTDSSMVYAIEIKSRPDYKSHTFYDSMISLQKVNSMMTKDIPDYGSGVKKLNPNENYKKLFVTVWADDVLDVWDVAKGPDRKGGHSGRVLTIDPDSPMQMLEDAFFERRNRLGSYVKNNEGKWEWMTNA